MEKIVIKEEKKSFMNIILRITSRVSLSNPTRASYSYSWMSQIIVSAKLRFKEEAAAIVLKFEDS